MGNWRPLIKTNTVKTLQQVLKQIENIRFNCFGGYFKGYLTFKRCIKQSMLCVCFVLWFGKQGGGGAKNKKQMRASERESERVSVRRKRTRETKMRDK